ncbi:MAG: transketolase C-terminal domain-containing protein [Bacillota bacterium]|jgi:transketolase|nr:transketolase C-terminal domain-containing protein [Bacillota bacterium]NLL26112.1 alpha-ketoacid dehydrogenase subunit beta [Erysipelotrichia bacterium]
MFKLVENRNEKGEQLSIVFCQTVSELMNDDEKLVFIDSDLASPSGSSLIEKAHPDRFINVGIAEANMVGVASGLSIEGFKPFIHSFAPFASRRVFDQIYLSGAYAKTTINVYGSDPGFAVGPNGGTHTSFEDVALYRTIPNAIIVDPADVTQLKCAVRQAASEEGIKYIRINRKAVRNVYEPGSKFVFGKGTVVKEGSDVLVITSGQILSDALDAAEELETKGVSVEVLDMYTIKPLDVDLILSEVEGKKAVVTFENHSIIGGLGSAVAEVLAENNVNVLFKRHGVTDRFGQVGTADFLQVEYNLTSKDLVKTIESLL